jgi:hypothetical protein
VHLHPAEATGSAGVLLDLSADHAPDDVTIGQLDELCLKLHGLRGAIAQCQVRHAYVTLGQ